VKGPTTLSILMIAGAYALFEVMMHPTNADRQRLLAVLAGVVVLAVILRLVVDQMAGKTKAITTLLGIPVFAAIAITAIAVLAAVKGMFFETEQIPILLVALAFGAGLAVFVAAGIGQRASRDLSKVISVAKVVGDGNLDSHTGVTRSDEIGDLANALDSMVAQLQTAKRVRDADDLAREAFLAAIGHDLRTPLTAINAALEAIEDHLADDPERYLRVISQQTRVMEHLVTDVTTLAALEAGSIKHEPTDVSELIDEAVEAFGPLSKRSSITITSQASGDGTVRGDDTALGRLIRNLLDNAVRHAETTVAISMAGDQDKIEVTVSDDGPGFAEQLRTTAFDRFVTGDESRHSEGFGLGLAIAQSVVKAHNGHIQLGEGPGGIVTFSLPR
jgi:signal transduction histidine kinase